MFKDKNVIIGITASIAAYKACELTRLFVKNGANVKIIATKSSLDFVSPLTLSTLSKNSVLHSLVDEETNLWNNHVDLALWADFLIIAPVTAKTISKMALGNCDNLLLSVFLSSKCPVFIAPAMDLDMFTHNSTRSNLKKLKSTGVNIIDSPHGELASGLTGHGRMAEPIDIYEYVVNHYLSSLPLFGKSVLITAGPTYEMIDPVRYIGNFSSGKMGVALATEFANMGAQVTLVLGPSSLKVSHPNIKIFNVVSAKEMYNVVFDNFKDKDISVFSAAVSDYTPVNTFEEKIKKTDDSLSISFKKNIDILSEVSKNKSDGQIIVGFALESNNEFENAKKKLIDKNLDFIVLNSLNDKSACFMHDTNKISILDRNNISGYELKSKNDVAIDIINKILELINEKKI